jgi:hypothetical protein
VRRSPNRLPNQPQNASRRPFDLANQKARRIETIKAPAAGSLTPEDAYIRQLKGTD